jgi:hypothetical protein
MKPRFTHDCDRCKFHGSGYYMDQPADFYTCETFGGLRSFIARYGNDGPEYSSGPLFCCAELTNLDKIALFNHLELTKAEEKKLQELCIKLVKDNIFSSVKACKKYSCCIDLGIGNIMFKEGD